MTSEDHFLLLEGGGSRTWAALATGTNVLGVATGASTNPRSVGDAQATVTMTELITQVLDSSASHGHIDPIGVVAAHGAASTTATAASFAGLLSTACSCAGMPGLPVHVVNDILPVLLRKPDGAVCVAIAGTGTGFAARHDTRTARASGLEWLLSDEGGGHDLAQAGLRAVVRALDHRGPQTALTDAAAAWCGHVSGPLGDALFETVYISGHARKPHVATFAPSVLAAATAGDAVATALVDSAADALASGVRAVCADTGITEQNPLTLILSGSLLTGSSMLRHRLTELLGGVVSITDVLEHAEADHATAMLALGRALRQTTLPVIADSIPFCVNQMPTDDHPVSAGGAA
ncbi:N-acetylglucosamine kinase [Amycolatopsis eburnea]|uniref:ATPase BadF/BadG/BcrA/BcrD type domain-containing protein n=1 Tax=Amycolatopsis eburnea TaxID=2267691 RepID=A0A427T7P0_9PSEU|nr:BadF/BadG/BcrA/BcrD ATPase family protein [Amycolatopsis eburnea]RSD16365.1 hypothetical protein EIY87_22195 [Amycolatopsis eburnea]